MILRLYHLMTWLSLLLAVSYILGVLALTVHAMGRFLRVLRADRETQRRRELNAVMMGRRR